MYFWSVAPATFPRLDTTWRGSNGVRSGFATLSLSPMKTLKQMRPSTSISAVTGSKDKFTLPEYAESYVGKAKQAGITASMSVLEGKGHEILNDPTVMQQVATTVRSLR
jgi:hypothetical protein